MFVCCLFKQVFLWLKVAQCHGAIKSYPDAIRVYHQGKLLKCCWDLGTNRKSSQKFSKG